MLLYVVPTRGISCRPIPRNLHCDVTNVPCKLDINERLVSSVTQNMKMDGWRRECGDKSEYSQDGRTGDGYM